MFFAPFGRGYQDVGPLVIAVHFDAVEVSTVRLQKFDQLS